METSIKKQPILIKDLGMQYATKNSNRKRRYGLYECPLCYEPFKNLASSVKANKITKCNACAIATKKMKHGETRTTIHDKWTHIKQRCLNKKDRAYKNYGGRGISIYEPWTKDYKAFRDYVLSLPNAMKKEYSVDRFNNDGNYEPMNLRWVDMAIQAQNTRRLRLNNTSGYRGVHKNKKYERWIAKIQIKGKSKHIGHYETAKEAGKAYDGYVIENNLNHTTNGLV